MSPDVDNSTGTTPTMLGIFALGVLCAPKGIHNTVIGAFDALVETCVFNSKCSHTGQYRNKLNIVLMKVRGLICVDTHNPDGHTVNLLCNTENRYKPSL